MRTALITGITGQDGSYLAEHLVGQGYRVVGTVHNSPRLPSKSLLQGWEQIELAQMDLMHQESIENVLSMYRPDEVYNLAARASSRTLIVDPTLTAEVNGMAVARLLDAIRVVNPNIRFCQASSSEMYGKSTESPQDEATAFRPRNPYGVAKLFAHGMVGCYREHYGLFACSAILFNHESPRRSEEFVTRKVSRAAALIQAGLSNSLELGDLEARRDWGFAGDYVRAMHLMLRAEQPSDYVIATGETHSVRELCELAFSHLRLDYRRYVVLDPSSVRGPESVRLVGNPSRALSQLGWRPSVSFEVLVKTMVDADVLSISSSQWQR